MKKQVILSLFLASCILLNAQDAVDILRSSKARCQSVTEGYYELKSYFKSMSENDTAINYFTCHFKKLKDDTLFSSAFHFKVYNNDEYRIDYLYTGEDLAIYSTADSSGQIISKSRWPDVVKSYNQLNTLYNPLTSKDGSPLPVEPDYLDTTHYFKFIGQELINDQACYHIQINDTPFNEPEEPLKANLIEFNYWISITDNIPVQYSLSFDLTMNGDSLYQYEKYTLTKYDLNQLWDESALKLSSVPPYVRLKEYSPDY